MWRSLSDQEKEYARQVFIASGQKVRGRRVSSMIAFQLLLFSESLVLASTLIRTEHKR